MSFINELKRRNVFRVAIAYAIVAWLLLQVADVVLPTFRTPEWVMPAFTVLLILGLPLALILAWAFELTPEGIKKEKNVVRSESITHLTGRKFDFAIIGLMAVAIIYLVLDNYVLEQAPSNTVEEVADKSIAVLPLVPLSSGEDDGYFADGLTEEILNALAQLPELRVTARTSSFFFKGQNLPVPEIADRLNVVYVVEGSVQRDGDRLRITVQLIKADDGFHVWSETYDRTLDDVFAVQEDIAENIAAALNVVLDDNARRLMRSVGIRDVGAFIAYQKGLEAFITAHTEQSDQVEYLPIANAFFDQALEAAPDLAVVRFMKADLPAHIILAIATGSQEKYPGEAQEALEALREEYDEAWRRSPPGNQRDIIDVERTLISEDWSRLPDRIQKAMQPGGCPWMNWTGQFIGPFGWAEQVADKYRERIACDPMDNHVSIYLARILISAGDPEAALRAVEEAEDKGIQDSRLESMRYWALLAAGRVNDARVQGSGSRRDWQILWEALVGDPAIARKLAEEYWSRPDADDSRSLPLAAAVGDRERANEIAARADAQPGGIILISAVVMDCLCGAPFDLEFTPNYKARIEEAGFPWPPPKRIDYPAKTW